MKKTVSLLFAILILTYSLCFSAFAGNSQKLYDNAGYLTEEEARELQSFMKKTCDELEFEIVIVTESYVSDTESYADDFYDYNDFGYNDSNDGCLLLVTQNAEENWMSTTGYGIIFLDHRLRGLSNEFHSVLGSEGYFTAFKNFVSGVKTAVTYERENFNAEEFTDDYGGTVDPMEYIDNIAKNGSYRPSGLALLKYKFSNGEMTMPLAIAVILGIIIGFIYSGSHKKKLKTVAPKQSAVDYVVPGSLYFSRREDIFLFKNVTMTKKPEPESHSSGGSSGGGIHTGSSGTSHGGGRF